MAGTLLGGFVAAKVSLRDDRWKLWAPAITSGLAGPVFALCMLTQDFTMMVAMLALTSFLVGFQRSRPRSAPCCSSGRRAPSAPTSSGQPEPAQAFMKASMSAINRSLCVSGSGCGAPS